MADDKKVEQKAATVEVKQDSIALGIAMGVQAALQQLGIGQHKPEAITAASETAARYGKGECSTCHQMRSACEDKHTQMIVYPQRYPEFAEYFPGVIINGQKYLSNNEGHSVTVPACSVGDILKIVRDFEEGERINQMGRKKRHHSGVLSPNGAAVNPYAGQGFR